MKRLKSLQQKFRVKKFEYHQYWDVLYIEDYKDGTYKTFATIIKAKSADLVKKIIKQKVAEDIEGAKVKFLQLNMFHKKYGSKKYGKLTLEQWENIRNASFPNIANALHKKHIPNLDNLREVRRENLQKQRDSRPEGDELGFKKGKENWSAINRGKEALPEDQRQGKKWAGGHWEEWDRDDMEKTKNRIINALIISNNVRTKAAEHLGINRNTLNQIMSRIPGVDWKKDYPLIKPFSNANYNYSEEKKRAISEKMRQVMKERIANGNDPFAHLSQKEIAEAKKKARATVSAKRQKSIETYTPMIKDALKKNGNIRRRAAFYLGKTDKWLKYWMDNSSHLVDWDKEYPCPKWSKK